MKNLALAFLALLALLCTQADAATLAPSHKFRTIETEHFYIHYHQGLHETSQIAAISAEMAHTALSNALGWEPSQKTHMVLTDSSDLANGFATVLPYNLIYIYTVPPQPDMTIGQYRQWLSMVITHEYAHIVVMDTTTGYSRYTRMIFGKSIPGLDPVSFFTFLFTAPPNIFLPNWWLEGTAVWSETEFNATGRGSGTYYEMIFRTAVAEDNLPEVDMINGEHPDWPAGSMPYIYGLALMRHIADTYGPEALGELNMAHASRLPFLISAPAQRRTKKTYKALFNEAMDELRSVHTEKINAITGAGLTVPAILNMPGESTTNPVPSPDGSMVAALLRDPHRHRSIIITAPEGGKVLHSIRTRPSGGRISWGPDSRMLYFTEAELHGGYNLYLDLYAYDLKKENKVRLTHGLRIKEPSISANGQWAAAVMIGRQEQSLVLVPLGPEGEPQKLITFKDARVSHPAWSPSNESIVFSVRKSSGRTSIVTFNTTTGTDSILLEADHDLEFPSFVPGGGKIIYVSDETGVYNIYEYNMDTGQTRRLTNLLGGAMHPAAGGAMHPAASGAMNPAASGAMNPAASGATHQGVDDATYQAPGGGGNRLYFSSYTSGGFHAAYIEYPADTVNRTAPSIAGGWPEDGFFGTRQLYTDNPAQHTTQASGEKADDRPYSSLSSALPRFWLPMLWYDHTGTLGGAFTAGQDALMYHTYYLGIGAGGNGRGYYQFEYVYDHLYPALNLRASRIPVQYHEFFGTGGDLYDQWTSREASISFPLKRLEKTLLLEMGYQRLEHETLEGAAPVFEGRRDNIFAALTFTNALRYPYSVSLQEGRTITLEARDYSKARGSDIDSREYSARYEEYLGVGGHKTIYLKLSGGASKGQIIAQQAFRIGGTEVDNPDYPLRGYPAGYRAGRYISTATLEFRAPLSRIFRGSGTLPIYHKQLHWAVFTDAGAVWDDNVNKEMVDMGAGMELRMDMTLGYKAAITPAVGVAHGFSKQTGENQIYFVIRATL